MKPKKQIPIIPIILIIGAIAGAVYYFRKKPGTTTGPESPTPGSQQPKQLTPEQIVEIKKAVAGRG